MKISKTFNGTGAAVYLCLGFIPDEVKILALEDSDCAHLWWNRAMRAAEMIEGVVFATAGGITGSPKTVGNGVTPYFGGDLMTTTNQTSTGYGEGVYLEVDTIDYRKVDVVTAGDVIGKWTYVTGYTGYWDKESAHGYIGEGSKIVIDGKEYVVTALTDGGETSPEVTLNKVVASGTIGYIGGMYDFKPVPIGKVAKAGIKLNITSVVNENDEMQMLVASSDNAIA